MDTLHQYNYKQVVREIREADAKQVKWWVKRIFFGAALLFAGVQVLEWIIEGYNSNLHNWYIGRFVGMMWVVIIFLIYLYTVHKTDYEKNIALEIMLMRAKTVAIDCTEKPSVEWIFTLKGRTYSQLDAQERACLAQLVLDKAYLYRDVFSESDLKSIAKAESFAEFERLMNASSHIINHREKFVLKRYEEAYS